MHNRMSRSAGWVRFPTFSVPPQLLAYHIRYGSTRKKRAWIRVLGEPKDRHPNSLYFRPQRNAIDYSNPALFRSEKGLRARCHELLCLTGKGRAGKVTLFSRAIPYCYSTTLDVLTKQKKPSRTWRTTHTLRSHLSPHPHTPTYIHTIHHLISIR